MDAPLYGTYGQVASSNDSASVDIDTAFMLASISKPFVGAAVAVLIDQGRLSLDDDICNVLGGPIKDGKINTACRNPFFPDTNVTWRMLVTHRSSLTLDLPEVSENYTAAYGPNVDFRYIKSVGNPSCPLDDVQQFYEDLFVDKETETTVGNIGFSVNWYDLADEMLGGVWNDNNPPGAVNSYSNVAVGYIASLIEKLTGEKFEQFCEANIFAPAGMNHTAWFMRDLPDNTQVAVPVFAYDETLGTWEDIGHYCFIDYASGQLYSSIRDMATYADLMLSYGIGTLWSNTTAMEHVFGCQERDVLGNLMPDNSTECQNALSWFHLSNALRDGLGDDASLYAEAVKTLTWTNGIEHSGGESGVATDSIILPESDFYAIVLLNTDEADAGYIMKVLTIEGMAMLNGDPPVGPAGYGEVPLSNDTAGDDAPGDEDGMGTGNGDDDGTSVAKEMHGQRHRATVWCGLRNTPKRWLM